MRVTRHLDRARHLLVAGLATLLLPAAAAAHQPGTVHIRLAQARASGPANLDPLVTKPDTRIMLAVTNDDPSYDVLLRLPACWFDDVSHGVLVNDLDDLLMRGTKGQIVGMPSQDPAWSACVESGKPRGLFLLRRGETAKVAISIDFRMLGNQHVRSFFDVFVLGNTNTQGMLLASSQAQADRTLQSLLAASTGARPSARLLEEVLRRTARTAVVPFSAFYALELDKRQRPMFRFATYEELYFGGHPNDETMGEGMTNVQYVDAMLPVALDDYQTFRRTVPDGLQWDPKHSDLLNIPTDTAGPQPGTCDCIPPTRHDCATFPCDTRTSPNTAGPADPRATTYTITGRFSSKWTDHTLHPAWGWRAVAWWNTGAGWINLAEDWVQWDGSYTLFVNYPGYAGQHLRMQFRAYNRYYEPRDGSDNLFRWKNPDRYNISTSWDDGHWYADCDGTNTNGLGEVYFRAYQLWSELYWRGGLNPLRDNPIKVYYPNTTYDCGDGSGVPWSCASVSGSVWLIAAHGLQRDVVQHEFGHQVNNEYHDNKRPAGAGGGHNLTVCYNTGLGLREGYADFMPYWVQANRSAVPDTTISGWNIESPGSSFCKTPGENNEGWVGATFWDLHDSASDGNDILWFNHEGAVHSIYLSHPPANDGDSLGMSNYRTYYRDAASAGHQGYIDDIFTQNDTD